jgi:hypothetical protein
MFFELMTALVSVKEDINISVLYSHPYMGCN